MKKYSIYDKHTYLSDLYQTPDENRNTVKRKRKCRRDSDHTENKRKKNEPLKKELA